MRKCRECGNVLAKPQRAAGRKVEFCGRECRATFNNRRAMRGAELYDYYMAMRYQRQTHGHLLAVMNQIASAWRDMDKAEREGRSSWSSPDPDGDPRALDTARVLCATGETATTRAK